MQTWYKLTSGQWSAFTGLDWSEFTGEIMSTTTLTNPQTNASVRCSISDGASPSIVSSIPQIQSATNLTAGSAAGQVNLCAAVAFTVTSSGSPFTFDVYTGTDPLGNTLHMGHVVAVLVTNGSVTAGQDFTVDGDIFSSSDSDFVQANGGVLYKCNPNPGWTVTSGSHDTISIAVAAGTNVPGQMIILGRTT